MAKKSKKKMTLKKMLDLYNHEEHGLKPGDHWYDNTVPVGEEIITQSNSELLEYDKEFLNIKPVSNEL